ncbi:uncharacterized protein LOC143452248 isoform X2 [Clavelina lepadiformis]|uniref:uncharacterized protein LOC143452248 isoform X2 n=1 Tax=Clavelina lepadiformis TaxID=159417 RepID=UPI004043105D
MSDNNTMETSLGYEHDDVKALEAPKETVPVVNTMVSSVNAKRDEENVEEPLTMPVNKTETCSVNNEQEDTEENVDEAPAPASPTTASKLFKEMSASYNPENEDRSRAPLPRLDRDKSYEIRLPTVYSFDLIDFESEVVYQVLTIRQRRFCRVILLILVVSFFAGIGILIYDLVHYSPKSHSFPSPPADILEMFL